MERFDAEKPKSDEPEDEETRHARLNARPRHLPKRVLGRKSNIADPRKPLVPGEMSDGSRSRAVGEFGAEAPYEDAEDNFIKAIDAEKERVVETQMTPEIKRLQDEIRGMTGFTAQSKARPGESVAEKTTRLKNIEDRDNKRKAKTASESITKTKQQTNIAKAKEQRRRERGT